MTAQELLKKMDKELGYVNASREAHFHIQAIIDENKRLLLTSQANPQDFPKEPKTEG